MPATRSAPAGARDQDRTPDLAVSGDIVSNGPGAPRRVSGPGSHRARRRHRSRSPGVPGSNSLTEGSGRGVTRDRERTRRDGRPSGSMRSRSADPGPRDRQARGHRRRAGRGAHVRRRDRPPGTTGFACESAVVTEGTALVAAWAAPAFTMIVEPIAKATTAAAKRTKSSASWLVNGGLGVVPNRRRRRMTLRFRFGDRSALGGRAATSNPALAGAALGSLAASSERRVDRYRSPNGQCRHPCSQQAPPSHKVRAVCTNRPDVGST